MRTPLGSPGAAQRRIISVSDGLSSIKFMGGPGTSNSTNKLWLKCFRLKRHYYTILTLSQISLFPVFLILTSLVRFERQRLRVGSLSLAVEYFNGQDIVGVRSEIADHFLLLVGPSPHYHGTFWLSSPPSSMVVPGAKPGQVDLKPQNQSQEAQNRETFHTLIPPILFVLWLCCAVTLVATFKSGFLRAGWKAWSVAWMLDGRCTKHKSEKIKSVIHCEGETI